MEQKFGNKWTLIKLDKVEEYIKAYMIVMKNQSWAILNYIDAFCGSGENVQIKNDDSISSSALRALEYSFDKYVFIDTNKQYVDNLETIIKSKSNWQKKNILYFNNDANKELFNIIQKLSENDKGIIFLDPYALTVSYDTLKFIAKSEKLDVWYLFPINALIRCMPKDGKKNEMFEDVVTKILGTNEWIGKCYEISSQINIFEENLSERANWQNVLKFVQKRFNNIFRYVCEKPKILYNNTSLLFALFFMCNSNSDKAVEIAKRISNHILKD